MPDRFRLALVLTFERLPLKLLSCYGSELGQTPVLDRLASRGILGDLHFVDDLDTARSRHAWWDGASVATAATSTAVETLPSIAARSGLPCRLISDCQPSAWDIAPQGWTTTYIEQPSAEPTTVTESLQRLREETARQLQELRDARRSAIVWVHCAELPEVPIPSMEFLELFLDELSGTRPQTAEAEEELATDDDEDDDVSDSQEDSAAAEESDTLSLISQDDREAAFELIEETLSLLSEESPQLEPLHVKTLNVLAAARLAECDQELGRFFELIEGNLQSGEALFLLTADRGLSLGESALTKRLESELLQGPLQEETMHVPLLLMPGLCQLGRRLGGLTSHADIPATLLDWFGIEHEFPSGRSLLPLVRGETTELRQQLVCGAGDWQAIREREWLLIRNRAEGIEKLYIKPDDRWQVLDVLAQNIEEADRLLGLLNDF